MVLVGSIVDPRAVIAKEFNVISLIGKCHDGVGPNAPEPTLDVVVAGDTSSDNSISPRVILDKVIYLLFKRVILNLRYLTSENVYSTSPVTGMKDFSNSAIFKNVVR